MGTYKSDTLRSTIKNSPFLLGHVFDLRMLWIYRSKEVLLVPYWPTGEHLERGVHDLMEVPNQDFDGCLQYNRILWKY